ncbi:MAG: hypothetical protein ACI8RD_013499, partial [Bacillariaceae sp.]
RRGDNIITFIEEENVSTPPASNPKLLKQSIYIYSTPFIQ